MDDDTYGELDDHLRDAHESKYGFTNTMSEPSEFVVLETCKIIDREIQLLGTRDIINHRFKVISSTGIQTLPYSAADTWDALCQSIDYATNEAGARRAARERFLAAIHTRCDDVEDALRAELEKLSAPKAEGL